MINSGGSSEQAARIVKTLDIDLIKPNQKLPPFLLELSEQNLSIRPTEMAGYSAVSVDFVSGKAAYRRGQSELIAKAVGVPKLLPMTVVDATAGLGRDAFVLASRGCDVVMIERHPIIFALLEDGLQRALADPSTAQAAQRMQLVQDDAVDWMKGGREAVDVVYLDPMFPPSKKSAAVKKEMQLFHDLLSQQSNSPDLLMTARACAKRRVVVKRPLKSQPLSEALPSYSTKGRSTRFDVYLRPVSK